MTRIIAVRMYDKVPIEQITIPTSDNFSLIFSLYEIIPRTKPIIGAIGMIKRMPKMTDSGAKLFLSNINIVLSSEV